VRSQVFGIAFLLVYFWILYTLGEEESLEELWTRVCIAKRLDSETRSNGMVVQARGMFNVVYCAWVQRGFRVDRGEEAWCFRTQPQTL
jgi:hypothetical protein